MIVGVCTVRMGLYLFKKCKYIIGHKFIQELTGVQYPEYVVMMEREAGIKFVQIIIKILTRMSHVYYLLVGGVISSTSKF